MGTDILDYLRSRKELKPAKAINSILSIFDLNQTKLTLKGIPRIFNSYSSIEQAIIDIFYSGDFPRQGPGYRGRRPLCDWNIFS